MYRNTSDEQRLRGAGSWQCVYRWNSSY